MLCARASRAHDIPLFSSADRAFFGGVINRLNHRALGCN